VVTRRAPVGAHYGLFDWLAQRITAIAMTLYALLVAGIALWNGGVDYALWRALFDNAGFRLATFVFMVSLLYHAWVGAREIYMDYLKPVALRLAVQAATIVLLIAYLGWTVQILWGSHA
jgi:succinate dehydrogenase / fumarate reductase membrane anchor subunit